MKVPQMSLGDGWRFRGIGIPENKDQKRPSPLCSHGFQPTSH